MKVIYQPKGRALEFSELALNHYTFCTHGCSYCFCPNVLHKTADTFFKLGLPRRNILHLVDKDALDMQKSNDKRHVHLCFIGDPYQPIEKEYGITRGILRIFDDYGINAQILTKGGPLAIRDFDLFQKNPDWKFGITLSFNDNDEMRKWEPQPSGSVTSRMLSLLTAKDKGIRTWISIEPVIDPVQSLMLIEDLLRWECVDHWKIGKINHMPEIEKQYDWNNFLMKVEDLLQGQDYYIKQSLEKFRR